MMQPQNARRIDLIHQICDYASGDMAETEVFAALMAAAPGVPIKPTPVRSFNTVETAFVTTQLGLAEPPLRPREVLLYVNCAPRKDIALARANNAGEPLVYGELSNGVRLVAVNSGFSLSLVREQLKSLHLCKVANDGTQFRSARVFPWVVDQLYRGETDFLGEAVDPLETIPEMPQGLIGYIDSFGNLKLTTKLAAVLKILQYGQRVSISLGEAPSLEATFCKGIFAVEDGQLAYAPGSSGHGQDYMEVSRRGGHANIDFGHPEPGNGITIRALALDPR
jgi:hypothetical protein